MLILACRCLFCIFQKENVPCQHLVVASGHESTSDIALASAVRSDSWVIIENIHCASSAWLRQLYVRLERLRAQAGRLTKDRFTPYGITPYDILWNEIFVLFEFNNIFQNLFSSETSSSPGQWRVFLTTKPSLELPESLLYLAHPLAWDFVQTEANQRNANVSSFDNHLNVDLVSGIITTLNVSRLFCSLLFLIFPIVIMFLIVTNLFLWHGMAWC